MITFHNEPTIGTHTKSDETACARNNTKPCLACACANALRRARKSGTKNNTHKYAIADTYLFFSTSALSNFCSFIPYMLPKKYQNVKARGGSRAQTMFYVLYSMLSISTPCPYLRPRDVRLFHLSFPECRSPPLRW